MCLHTPAEHGAYDYSFIGDDNQQLMFKLRSRMWSGQHCASGNPSAAVRDTPNSRSQRSQREH